MPKRGDIVAVDGNLAVYLGEADHYDDTGTGQPGALVHVFDDATVVPAGSVSSLADAVAAAVTPETTAPAEPVPTSVG